MHPASSWLGPLIVKHPTCEKCGKTVRSVGMTIRPDRDLPVIDVRCHDEVREFAIEFRGGNATPSAWSADLLNRGRWPALFSGEPSVAYDPRARRRGIGDDRRPRESE